MACQRLRSLHAPQLELMPQFVFALGWPSIDASHRFSPRAEFFSSGSCSRVVDGFAATVLIKSDCVCFVWLPSTRDCFDYETAVRYRALAYQRSRRPTIATVGPLTTSTLGLLSRFSFPYPSKDAPDGTSTSPHEVCECFTCYCMFSA